MEKHSLFPAEKVVVMTIAKIAIAIIEANQLVHPFECREFELHSTQLGYVGSRVIYKQLRDHDYPTLAKLMDWQDSAPIIKIPANISIEDINTELAKL